MGSRDDTPIFRSLAQSDRVEFDDTYVIGVNYGDLNKLDLFWGFFVIFGGMSGFDRNFGTYMGW